MSSAALSSSISVVRQTVEGRVVSVERPAWVNSCSARAVGDDRTGGARPLRPSADADLVGVGAGRADAGLRADVLGVEERLLAAWRAALASIFENSQMPTKAIVIENSAGLS